ncbi:MAG: ABC transporter ATP-binding protein [Lactobacillales bacterium]|jgi:oligopeptide/dipeptide ABC transporter ATP-binding protein|nr:ABC transporter ATP-binding protein [Lactobacillales bacterium]
MCKDLLKIENLKINFKIDDDTFCAVNRINFALKKGKTLGIVGESGSGKSVFSQAVLGLLPKNASVSGKIIFENQDITTLSNNELQKIRGDNIAMIFQDHMAALNPLIKVGKQIREAIMLHQNISKSEAKQKAVEMLKQVKISNSERRYKEYPHQLSGGMRQRIMIAMALSCNPKILICDEPTTALDVTTQAQVLKLINDLKNNFGTSVIMITHDLGVIAETSDDVVVMYAGRIMEIAIVEQIFNNALHPYTIGLLKSISTLNLKDKKLIGIKGNVPSPQNINSGCPFYFRCENRQDICKNKFPEATDMNGHIVYCHNFLKKG